jgi:phenylacetate-CoA ligase
MLAYRAKSVGAWGFGRQARRVNIDHLNPHVLATEARPMFYEKLGIMPRLNLDWRTPRAEIVARIARFKPDLISGPPSLLAELADELTDADRARIDATRVLTGSERLSASMRARIERGFGCPVADIYGCVELVFIAMEAPEERGYRLCEEAVIVEVLAQGASATKGEIHLTGLHQWSMPFIRYRLGDDVEVTDGAGPHRLLRAIDGRVTDRFRLPDGRELHGYELGELIERCSLAVRRFQITQVRRDAFHVRLVLATTSPAALAALDRSFRDTLGPTIACTVEVVASLDRPHRKFYPFVSYERLEKLRAAGTPP